MEVSGTPWLWGDVNSVPTTTDKRQETHCFRLRREKGPRDMLILLCGSGGKRGEGLSLITLLPPWPTPVCAQMHLKDQPEDVPSCKAR